MFFIPWAAFGGCDGLGIVTYVATFAGIVGGATLLWNIASRDPSQYLGAMDYYWLVAEKEHDPMNCIGVFELDGEIDIEDIRSTVLARIVMPHRRFSSIPNIKRAFYGKWESDVNFRIDNHVTLAPGIHSDSEVEVQIATMGLTKLSRDRPLWTFRAFRHSSGKTSLVAVVHHAVADGVATITLVQGLIDPVDYNHPEVRRHMLGPRAVPVPTPTSAFTQGSNSSHGSGVAPLATATRAAGGAAADSGDVAVGMTTKAKLTTSTDINNNERNRHKRTNNRGITSTLSTFVHSLVDIAVVAAARPPADCPLIAPKSGQRICASVTIPLDRVKAVAKENDATINDVVVAMTGAGVRGVWLDMLRAKAAKETASAGSSGSSGSSGGNSNNNSTAAAGGPADSGATANIDNDTNNNKDNRTADAPPIDPITANIPEVYSMSLMSLRPPLHAADLAVTNNFSTINLLLPTSPGSAKDRVAVAKARCDALKASFVPHIGITIAKLMTLLPAAANAKAIEDATSAISFVLTNVAGPRFANTFGFARVPVVGMRAFAPIAGGICCGATVLSYNGQLHMSAYGDAAAMPNMQPFVDEMIRELERLEAEAML